MQILLTNIHSIHNAGDQVLMETTVAGVQGIFPDCALTLAMDDPDENTGAGRVTASLMAWVKSPNQEAWIYRHLLWLLPAVLLPVITARLTHRPFYGLTPSPLKGVLKGYFQADLVISGPGGFLYSSGKGLAFLVSLFSILLGWMAGKPVYLFPQSIGPLRKKWEGRLLYYTLKKARLVLVREPVSYSMLRALGLRPLLIPDLAFGFPSPGKQFALNYFQRIGLHPEEERPWLGVTTLDWESQNQQFKSQASYEQELQSAIVSFIREREGRVFFFPQVLGPAPSRDDRIPARRICARLKEFTGSTHLIDEEISPEGLKSLYSCMDLFIGTRLHSLIFSMSELVPSIGIGYQPKTRGVFQMLGLEDWIIDIDKIESGVLSSKLSDLWASRGAIKETLTKKIPPLSREIQEGLRLVAKDFHAGEKASF